MNGFPSWTDLIATGWFLVVATLVAIAWGRALWYFDERSEALRRAVFFVLRFTARRAEEVRSLLLSLIYYTLGVLSFLLLMVVYRLPIAPTFACSPAILGLALVGLVGEMSLVTLLIDLACRVSGQGRPEQFAEIQEIPWMKSVGKLPVASRLMVTALGGAVEETLFRGAILRVLLDALHLTPALAILLSGGLFCLEQLVLVRTRFQALIILCACISISLVGGMLVVATGSVLPGLLSHASFAVFFMSGRPRQQ